ncbi:integral membrane protein MviN [Streptomyces sp. NBRC 110611]|nr:integral membrane protein MviN [Streptomyces sp. NBRC 110611]
MAAARGICAAGCREEVAGMPGSARTMAVLTVSGLVVATAYTVAMGANGWVWFSWVVLALVTLGVVAARPV